MELKEMIPEEKAAEVKHWLSKSSEGMLAKRNWNEYFAHARYRKEKKAQLNLALAIKKNLTEQING